MTGWLVVAQDGAMPSPVTDEIPTDHPHHHPHHHHLPSPNPVVNVLLAGCAYEIVATGVNTWLDEPTLPLLSNGVRAFSWKAFGAAWAAWALPAGLVGVGFVCSRWSSSNAVGRRRREARKGVRSRALPVLETSRS